MSRAPIPAWTAARPSSMVCCTRSPASRRGLAPGFQWLDGSFLEHVEQIEGRVPNDMDVVTFYRLSAGTSQAQLAERAGALLDHHSVKSTYRADGYLVHLGMEPGRLTRQSAYWYSVWSHRRNQLWKPGDEHKGHPISRH